MRRFAASCFGEELADEVADILTKYPKIQSVAQGGSAARGAVHHFIRNIASDKAAWTFLPDLGRGETAGDSPVGPHQGASLQGRVVEWRKAYAEKDVEQDSYLK